MLLGRRLGIVVEVVDNESVAVGREGDVKLEEEGSNGSRNGLISGEGEQYISILVDIVDQDVGSELGTEALGLWRQEDEVVVCEIAVLE
jgi:hypothetical protein